MPDLFRDLGRLSFAASNLACFPGTYQHGVEIEEFANYLERELLSYHNQYGCHDSGAWAYAQNARRTEHDGNIATALRPPQAPVAHLASQANMPTMQQAQIVDVSLLRHAAPMRAQSMSQTPSPLSDLQGSSSLMPSENRQETQNAK